MERGERQVQDDDERHDGEVAAQTQGPLDGLRAAVSREGASAGGGRPHKLAAARLRSRMDAFTDRLTDIRAQLDARNRLVAKDYGQRLPLIHKDTSAPPASPTASMSMSAPSTTRMKLPLLQQIALTKEARALPRDPFVLVENIIHRKARHEVYMAETDKLVTREVEAARTAQEAERLGEEARKSMVTYTQNERGWHFEERSRRYQQVMEMKQAAESAQLNADVERATVKQMRTLLRDPYGGLRAGPVSPTLSVSPLQEEEFIWMWILAAPSSKLGFTPRAETPGRVVEGEKELSMYVVYYISASLVNNKRANSTEEEWQQELDNDCPPESGWICSSAHGVPPAPMLTPVKSSMQTWAIAGAGAGHLNGKYISSGMHDHVRKFKSSAGVELFRKRLPVSSAIMNGLHGGGSENTSSAVDNGSKSETSEKPGEYEVAPIKTADSGIVLPTGLAAIEKDEHDFRSMQRVGSWLSTNESTERHRRMQQANRSAEAEPAEPLATSSRVPTDGDNVMNQDPRETVGQSDVAHSRPEASAPLCREWVLFMSCSKRQVDKPASEGSVAPKRGIGLGCLKRHHYISHEEEATMTVWAQTKESWLEKNVLAVVIEREAHVQRVKYLCRKCMDKFQQNLRKETEKLKRKILAELNRIRFLSVKVLESVDIWRDHARKIGFARFDAPAKKPGKEAKNLPASDGKKQGKDPTGEETEAPLLGWSSSITMSTGKQLYKGSKAFVSKVKRFRRAEDFAGRKEHHIVYLGYFETQAEAERAYDEHAASEARRLNTTVEHLPSRRNVFRSCGKHFAVESERAGPSFCIECKTKELASRSSGSAADDWIPPFFYGAGVNYIMKMGNDLDFLDDVLPLKTMLNDGHGRKDEPFPMRGNVFLLPRTPIQDPELAIFTSFPSSTAPRLGDATGSEDYDDIDDEALDRERIFNAQKIFLQELQIYQPEVVTETCRRKSVPNTLVANGKASAEPMATQFRVVEALYWDRCAALKIQQQRPPMALRQPNVWCRPDAGEWSSLVIRGAHQQHFLFEEKLAKAGREMQQRRQQVLQALRRLIKTPLYFVVSRTSFTELIAAGHQVKGDVVLLEVKNTAKRLQRYDTWCSMSLVVQRWFRGVLGRMKTRAIRKALRIAYQLRTFYARQVVTVAQAFFAHQVRDVAVRRAARAIRAPVYTRAISMDGEVVIVTFHSLRHYKLHHLETNREEMLSSKHRLVPSTCCASCARRFQVKAHYQSYGNRFGVFRGICTCHLNGGSSEDDTKENSEGWMLRAYSPYHNVVYRLRLEAGLLQQLISAQSQAHLLATGSFETSRGGYSLIFDKERSHHEAGIASRQATYSLRRAAYASEELSNWRRLSGEATQTRKGALLALEKSSSTLDNIKRAHTISIGNAKKALDFASRPFSEAQAWDPLENANDWQLIVDKRRLEKRLEAAKRDVERCRVEFFQATYNEKFARAGAAQAQEVYNRKWLPLVERESQLMEAKSVLETMARTRMESCMRELCDRFLALQDGHFLPTRRHLVVQSPVWHTMAPFHISIPGLQRRRNYLRRRTILLSNMEKQARKTRRMVVTVSMCPLLAGVDHSTRRERDMWVTAYDPADCSMHDIFLEWDLVRLLTGTRGKRIFQDTKGSSRSAWRAVAEVLLSLAMLDRFTGEFTLQKLQFYHQLRRLKPQFLSSRVMRDLEAGRKCGQGDEVLRQGTCIDGRLCVVVVYENWGDLTFAIYHSASGAFFRLVLPLTQVFDLLGSKPIMLRLWVSCVKSNSYSAPLLSHLLKHVRFHVNDEGHEEVRIEPNLPSQKRSRCYQKALKVQGRNLLVSIRENGEGDVQVSAFDLGGEHTYTLLLEREKLRLVLKTAGTSVDPAPTTAAKPAALSSSSLLLRRNRGQLYEWICGRLRFQSLLEHPETLTAGASPLLSGIHLRQSFRMFNHWIASSPRNPVSPVSDDEISWRAAKTDTAAFGHLQFDQLTLVGQRQMPISLEKEYAGTMNWIDAAAGPVTKTFKEPRRRKQLPYMMVDFFVKSHNLFARLRGEVEAEARVRRKRETWRAVEQADCESLYAEIHVLLVTATEEISRYQQHLIGLNAVVTRKLEQWGQIHQELKTRVKNVDATMSSGDRQSVQPEGAGILKEDSTRMFLELLESWKTAEGIEIDLFDVLSATVPSESAAPLADVSSLLRVCLDRITHEFEVGLRELQVSFKQLMHVDRVQEKLDKLRVFRAQVTHFSNKLARRVTTPVADTVSTESKDDGTAQSEPVAIEDQHVQQEVEMKSVIAVEVPTAIMEVNTGILIPSESSDPVQEVFLADTPLWSPSPTSPFAKQSQMLMKILRPLFQEQQRKLQQAASRFGRRASSTVELPLIAKRVSQGVLVYQESGRHSSARRQLQHWNPRAGSLAGDTSISGLAFFCPFGKSGKTSSWYRRLIDGAAIFSGLTTIPDETKSEDMYTRCKTVTRSTKLLPWKLFATEKLRTARAVKRSRRSEGLHLMSLKGDVAQQEREDKAIATVCVGFRQLEITFGEPSSRVFAGTTDLAENMKAMLALHQAFCEKERDRETSVCSLSLSNPRVMQHTLVTVDNEGQPIRIPCVSRDGDDVMEMTGVQVEIDNVERPHRLLFSCRELQTRRRYGTDCDYYELQHLLSLRDRTAVNSNSSTLLPGEVAASHEIQWRKRAEKLRVQDWRQLAAIAATLLVFRKKNGVLSLCLEALRPLSTALPYNTEVTNVAQMTVTESGRSTNSTHGRDDSAPKTKSEVLELSPLQHAPPSLLQNQRSRAERAEEKIAIMRSLWRRFERHQSAIRAATCERTLARTAPPSDLGSRTSSEWVRMTQEDRCAQDLRGLLVLEASVLKQLEAAYMAATRRVRAQSKAGGGSASICELQIKEFAKVMGMAVLQVDDFEKFQNIRETRRQRRQRGKDGDGFNATANDKEAQLMDLAEWWRQHLNATKAAKG